MRKRLLRILLALVLCVSLCLSMAAPAFAASADTGFTSSETYLCTSYNKDNYIELSISGNTLTIRGKLLLDGLTGVLVECGSAQTHEYVSSGTAFSLRLTLNHNGYQSVDIYTGLHSSSSYWSYNYDRIYIEKTEHGYRIMPSLVQENNTAFEQIELDPNSLLGGELPASVVAKSNEIVGSETDDYTKVFLLHKWVAENIYYDHDALSGNSSRIDDSAGVLAARRAVCEGYSNLLKDLILAQGIPAMRSTNEALHGSYALGMSAGEAHAHTEAYVDGRWITMDSTWDSRNTYRDGEYIAKAPDGYCYFDITSELFAMDHRIMSRGDINYITDTNGFRIRVRDGALVGYEGKGGDVLLPSNITHIEAWAFQNCTTITSVVIPEGVTSIGYEAFKGCTNLVRVTLPDSVTKMDESVFSNCCSLKRINLPAGLTSIPGYMFSDCTSLEHIVIPENITSIDNGAFQSCSSLQSIFIPDSVTSIGYSVFYGCTALTEATISGSVVLEYWDQSIFANCINLKRVTLGNGITMIPNGMFENCRSLTSVAIPVSVTGIEYGAFRYCTGLTDVYYGGTAAQWSAITVSARNDSLKQAEVHYSSTMPEPSALEGLTVSNWAKSEVEQAIRKGIVPDDLPADYTKPITRAQFCRIATALYETMTGETIEVTASFLDTDDIYVRKMASLGVVNGVGNHLFKPNDTLKRDQAATILARLAEAMGNELTAVSTPFTDVPINWATDSIAKIYGIGVMNGTNDGTTFTPAGIYTIEQSILTALRLMNYMRD